MAICLGTLGNLISFLYRNPPEPHQPSPPKPSGTSLAICNLISYYLDWNPPEPHQPSALEGSGTLRNLLRNLVLQLRRIAPELFWAKDPIASFAVGRRGKRKPKLLSPKMKHHLFGTLCCAMHCALKTKSSLGSRLLVRWVKDCLHSKLSRQGDAKLCEFQLFS